MLLSFRTFEGERNRKEERGDDGGDDGRMFFIVDMRLWGLFLLEMRVFFIHGE